MRQWISLTDEDRQAAFKSLPNALDGFLKLWGWLHFAKAIEEKVREKNCSMRTPSPLLTPRDWQAEATVRAAKLTGTPEGALALVEAKRYGVLADEIERLRSSMPAAVDAQDRADLIRAARYLTSDNDDDSSMPAMEADRIASVLRRLAGVTGLHAREAAARGVSGTSAPLNGIRATWVHDEGAYAQCGQCGRYTLDPQAMSSDRPPVCDCGSKHGWSGSFKKPGPDAKWSGLIQPAFGDGQVTTALSAACLLDTPERELCVRIAESVEVGDGSHDFNAGAETMQERIVKAIRSHGVPGTVGGEG